MLTDLPEIVPNLAKNIQLNLESMQDFTDTVHVCSRVLDWANESDSPSTGDDAFSVIVAADPIYSAAHPELLVNTVRRWLAPESASRFIVELPLRSAYVSEREDLRARLQVFMVLADEGTEIGYDDWEDANGNPAQVECWWSVWGPIQQL